MKYLPIPILKWVAIPVWYAAWLVVFTLLLLLASRLVLMFWDWSGDWKLAIVAFSVSFILSLGFGK